MRCLVTPARSHPAPPLPSPHQRRHQHHHHRQAASRWRGAGVAVPVFSLRSKSGMGVGEFLDIKKLVDWAVSAGVTLVQILPINDTSVYGDWRDSYPYKCVGTTVVVCGCLQHRPVLRPCSLFVSLRLAVRSSVSVLALHPIYVNIEALGPFSAELTAKHDAMFAALTSDATAPLDYEVRPNVAVTAPASPLHRCHVPTRVSLTHR